MDGGFAVQKHSLRNIKIIEYFAPQSQLGIPLAFAVQLVVILLKHLRLF